MCEQSEVQYLQGDIVWVKLGPCWWPGEVCDVTKLPSEIIGGFKKQPIAVVKFFQEDTYEYVKNLSQIYKYNCRKKNEFIKKGLDMHRAKNAFMDKFPADVCHAETLTGGDPDIITSDLFAPDKKPNYSSIFGTPSSKKSTKTGTKGKSNPVTTKTPKPVKSPNLRSITHPRFVGKSDHEVRILEQSTPTASPSHYSCHICGFESTRLNVIVLHNKSHSNGTYVPTPPKPKSKANNKSSKRVRRAKSFISTRSIEEDLALIRKGLSLSPRHSSESESEHERPKKSGKRKSTKGGAHNNKRAKVASIRNNLLADWGDSDSNEEIPSAQKAPEIPSQNVQENEAANNNLQNDLLPNQEESAATEPAASNSHTEASKMEEEKGSCFDFKDEEENDILEKSPGRKIPRVIPQKRVSLETEVNKYAADRHAESDVKIRMDESTDEHTNTGEESSDENVKIKEPDLIAFETILESTAVPKLPNLPDTKLAEDEEADAKDKTQDVKKTNGALKSSDHNEAVTSEAFQSAIAETAAPQLPKKRIVRNFEEFENLLNEQKLAEESKATLEVSKLKSQLMSKLNDLTSKQSDSDTTEDEEIIKINEGRVPPLETESDSDDSQNETDHTEDQSASMCSEEIINCELKGSKLDMNVSDASVEAPAEIIDEEMNEEEPMKKDEPVDDAVVEKKEIPDLLKEIIPLATETSVKSVADSTVEETFEPEKVVEAIQPVDEESIEEGATEEISTQKEKQPDTPIEDVEKPSEEPVEDVDTSAECDDKSIVQFDEPTEELVKSVEGADESLEEVDKSTVLMEADEIPEEQIQTDIPDARNDLPESSAEKQSKPESIEETPEETEVPEFVEEKVEAAHTSDLKEYNEVEGNEIITDTRKSEDVIESDAAKETLEDMEIDTDVTVRETKIVTDKEARSQKSGPPPEEHIVQDTKEESRSQKMLVDISDICIDNTDNLSGLSTLAAVSELTGNLYDKADTVTVEPVMDKEEEVTQEQSSIAEKSEKDNETTHEVVQVEEDIPLPGEPQVIEETLIKSDVQEPAPPKRVATLANFSMDFSDSNSESTVIKGAPDDDIRTHKVPENFENITKAVESEPKITSDVPGTSKESTLIVSDVPSDFESIENEIEKMSSLETNSDKLNSFPENISHPTTECDMVNTSDMGTTSDMVYQDYALPDSIKANTTSEFRSTLHEAAATPQEPATLESEIAKLTDTHPDANNLLSEQQQDTSPSKLLEILTETKDSAEVSKPADTTTGVTTTTHTVTKSVITTGSSQKVHMVITGDSSSMSKKIDPKTSKFVIKSAVSKSNKPIILSEKIIKPVTETENVSVKKVTSKRSYQDFEDIDTFIIQKSSKKLNSGDNDQQDIILTPKSEMKQFKGTVRGRGKPKIIDQTIIKAADVVQQVSISVSASEAQPLLDDSMFDINSMPIVLSDQILTPESIENMPVVMTDIMPSSSGGTPGGSSVGATSSSDKPHQAITVKRGGAIQQVKLLNKSKVTTSQPESPAKINQNVVVKNVMPRGLAKNQKVYQSASAKLLKNNPAVITQPGKPGKFIILPSSTASSTGGSKYTVGKRLSTIKNIASAASTSSASKLKAIQSTSGEPTGNKIMIVTNQQGVHSRLLLTPAQQKLLSSKIPPAKIAKNPSPHPKGNVIQKSILTSRGTILTSVNTPSIVSQKSNLSPQTIISSKGQIFATSSGQSLVTSEGQVLTPLTQQQLKALKPDTPPKLGKKVQLQQQSRVLVQDKSGEVQKGKLSLVGSKTKTILIKGSQGQTIKKIQSSIADTKTMVMAQPSPKSSQLMTISGQQMQGSVSSKQVVLTSKGAILKSDVKPGVSKQVSEKLQKLQVAKQSLAASSSRLLQKSPRAHMLLSPSGSKSAQQVSSPAVPPLAPITTSHSKKPDLLSQKLEVKEKLTECTSQMLEGIPLEQRQLLLQDTLGNQTVVTEGQILALPSGETIDGQAHSYVLVTVDEIGNLVPLSNDTLMSLDPSLGLGGDPNNIVLQIDQSAQDTSAEVKAEPVAAEMSVDSQTFPNTSQSVVDNNEQLLGMENQQLILSNQSLLTTSATSEQQAIVTENQIFIDKGQSTFASNVGATQTTTAEPAAPLLQDTQTVACSINSGESGQQLIITGDPESTQKFLASLSEGNTDLSSLLSGTDGNIIINTDGQQILLNTDSENQILLSVNPENIGLIQAGTESDATQSSLYITQQAMKNQDILAAALADTDVFQQEHAGEKTAPGQALTKVSSSAQSQLSPNSSLYPMNVGSVLETSLTLSSPIMTPLEVPSVNNKKITNTDIESALITQVPSSLELPITITDPSISQTVSQQVMLGNELQSNLDLPIAISDSGMSSIRSTEMSSPSFVYSLPTLDEGSELEQKRPVFPQSTTSAVITTDNMYNTALTGSMSMPLLTEEPELPTEQQNSTNHTAEEPPEVSTPETSIPASTVTQSNECTTYSAIRAETARSSITEKLPSELQIGTIDEELDLNSADICNSLSEPPPDVLPSDKPDATDDAPLNSLPALADSTAASAPSSAPPSEKPADECNLDVASYGMAEPADQPSIADDALRQDVSDTPNSPRLDIDENSAEIPIQPTIITNLSDNFDENNTSPEFSAHSVDSKKRPNEDTDADIDTKKTKLSSD